MNGYVKIIYGLENYYKKVLFNANNIILDNTTITIEAGSL